MIVNEYEYQRHLPHFQNSDKVYLVTFVTQRRWILPPAARDIVLDLIRKLHRNEAFVHTGVVMPDHVHLIIQPLWDDRGIAYPLSVLIGQLKGRSSRQINLLLERQGRVWQEEFHDHQIRSDESIIEKMDYVVKNPVRAGLGENYPWIFTWWSEETTG